MSPNHTDRGHRRLDGWGFSGAGFPASPELLAWLDEHLGAGFPASAFPSFDPAGFTPPDPVLLPDLPGVISDDPLLRLRHARGRGFSDLVRLRSGTVPALPDAVLRPADEDELEAILRIASAEGLRVIPWGGGTSVTGGVNVVPAGGVAGGRSDAPVVTVDLGALAGLEALDEASGLATFGAGTAGPRIEAELGERGFTLGHFPQSFELSTLGGWIVTRSTGQESLAYGRIENLVAGLDLVAPGGRLHLPALPASAAGPDLRQLVLGSEGRFGVLTRATVRVRRAPASQRVEAALLPDWERGVEAARQLVQEGVPLALLRLSDGPETEAALAVGLAKSAFAPLLGAYLRLRGLGPGKCLLLLGANGEAAHVDRVLETARDLLHPHGAVWLGARPGKNWRRDRFRHPYLRDALFDHGVATDTFETAAPWSRLGEIYRAVRGALVPAVEDGEREVPVLCHLSHPYRDGASLYFTFFFRCPQDPDAAIARWADLKRRATDALVAAGGTVSHHHGVGSWHAPWLEREVGETGLEILRRTAETLDPQGIMNPHVLLDPADRLEI